MKAKLTLLIGLPFLTLAVPAFAQGTAFTYQGRLNDGGVPANGSYDFQFAIYDSTNAPGTLVAGPITNPVVAVSNGLFTVVLDFGNSPFNGSDRWLAIAARSNTISPGAFTMLSPRHPLTATPYAVTAGTVTGAITESQLPANTARLNVANTTSQATGTVTITSGFITGASVTYGGSGYITPPAVTVNAPVGSGAVITAGISGGAVVVLTVANAGSGYNSGATITIAPPPSNGYQVFTSTNYFTTANLLTNVNNSFVGNYSGNGAGLSNLPAWRLGGNAGTTPGTQFIGTTDNQPLEIRVNGVRAVRLSAIPNDPVYSNIVNIVHGSPVNFAPSGAVGATIGGGGAANFNGTAYTNQVSGVFGTVGGGAGNTGAGAYSTVSGGNYNSAGSDAAVGGGYQNNASGGLSTIGGGQNNISSGQYSTVGGGGNNTSSLDYSTVAGGQNNTASGNDSTVGGGTLNTCSGPSATVSGGTANSSSGFVSTVGGGDDNNCLNTGSTIGGGLNNTNSGLAATIPGGQANLTTADFAFAAGRRAKANHQGAFVWADSTFADFASTAANQFLIRASGGAGLAGNAPFEFGFGVAGKEPSAGKIGYAVFTANTLDIVGGGTTSANRSIKFWCEGGATFTGVINSPSDRNLKTNFQALDPGEVLAKVVALPIQEWAYRVDDTKRHIGPMAQDFHAAFGLNGDDDKHIATVDADGVALAAIQGLNRKLEEARTENAALHHELAEIKLLLTRLSERNN